MSHVDLDLQRDDHVLLELVRRLFAVHGETEGVTVRASLYLQCENDSGDARINVSLELPDCAALAGATCDLFELLYDSVDELDNDPDACLALAARFKLLSERMQAWAASGARYGTWPRFYPEKPA